MKNFYKNKHFAIFQNSFCDWETGELLSPIQTQNYTVLQVAELHYNNAFIIKKHLQRCDLELIFPMTNGLFCSINGKEEKVYKHEIHLSFKGDKHEISSRIGCRFQSLAINFTPESENLLTSLRQSSTISRKKYIPDLAPYFKSIITEFLSTEQPFFLQSLDSLITSVLVGLARGDKALSYPFFSLTAPDLHNYIDDNFLDICSL
ncbi:MAG: hypothetical protein IKB20_00105, partial [Clostridia bacterium]|nr:hypothetical protein [Clostridia bacterium]